MYLMFHFLIWTSAWNIVHFFLEFKVYFVPYCFKYSCCKELLFINLYIRWLLQCVMDLTTLLSAFYLFIELLSLKENVLYMSFNAI